jgi:hypothetical protein
MTEGSLAAANLGSFDAFVAVLDDDLGFACRPDLNGDGSVDSADLGMVLTAWGSADSASDLDGNGSVDSADLGALLAAWGACRP